jgi:hypothetical protein
VVELLAAGVNDTTTIELHSRTSTDADCNGLLAGCLLEGNLIVLWHILIAVNGDSMPARM